MKQSKLDNIFIFQTKHISPYEPGMENLIINVPATKKQIIEMLLEMVEEARDTMLPLSHLEKHIKEL